MINRNEVLLKRAISSSEVNPYCVDLERSTVDEYNNAEFVVLRSDTDILSVFLVIEWQVKELELHDWPDYLLEEAEVVEV